VEDVIAQTDSVVSATYTLLGGVKPKILKYLATGGMRFIEKNGPREEECGSRTGETVS
jgi:hypothetical protein